MARFSLFAAAAAFTSLMSVAGAQPASSSAQAESLFRQARQLLDAGKVAEACAMFESSQKVSPATTTLFAAASCREKNGQLATAWGLFVEVQRETRNSSDTTDKQLGQLAGQNATKLEARLSQLTIAVSAAASSIPVLEVKLNGDTVIAGEWNHPLPLDGGTYQVTARAPGRREWSQSVTIKNEKDQQTVTVPALDASPTTVATTSTTATTPPPTGTGTTATTPPPTTTAQAGGNGEESGEADTGAPATHRNLTLPIAFGAGTVALAGVAVGFELWGEHINNQAKTASTDTDRINLWHSANWHRYVAEGAGIAGVASLGAAIFFYFHQSSVEVAPTATGHSGGVSLSGRF